jgi:hypothetical protein
VKIDGATALDDIVLEPRYATDFLPHASDILPQLTGSFIDTYSKLCLHQLYDRKTLITAADLLNDRVILLFESHGVKLMRPALRRPAGAGAGPSPTAAPRHPTGRRRAARAFAAAGDPAPAAAARWLGPGA